MKPNETNETLALLPGGELVRKGIADLESGARTVAACLVSIAATRLHDAGILPASVVAGGPEPERELYKRLQMEGGDAYSRYNALLRELASFTNALDHRGTIVERRP